MYSLYDTQIVFKASSVDHERYVCCADLEMWLNVKHVIRPRVPALSRMLAMIYNFCDPEAQTLYQNSMQDGDGTMAFLSRLVHDELLRLCSVSS